jgi:hypothetical protein
MQELENYIKKKEETTKELNMLIMKIKPTLESTLKELAKGKLN